MQSLFRDMPRARALLKNLDVSKALGLKQLKTSIDRDHEGSSKRHTLSPFENSLAGGMEGTHSTVRNSSPQITSAAVSICGEELRTIERIPCSLSIPSAIEFSKGVREIDGTLPCNQTSRVVQNGEIVLSFSLHSRSSSSLPKAQRMQDVDVLGSQTLRQLSESFSCGSVRGRTTEERPHNGSGNEHAYFLIEGAFYATNLICPSNSSENGLNRNSSLHGVRAVKDWLLNRNTDSRVGISTREQHTSVNPRDDRTDIERQVDTTSVITRDEVTDGAEESNGPDSVSCTRRASKRVRATVSSTQQPSGAGTEDGDTSVARISSSSASIPDESSDSLGAGNVSALITATEIVSSTERHMRRDGKARKKKGSKAPRRTFADNWVVDDSDYSDNDGSANASSGTVAMSLTTVPGSASTIASNRRESKKKARSALQAADPAVVGESQERSTTSSRLAGTLPHQGDRVQSLLEVHGLPPSSTLEVLSLDVAMSSIALRAGVRYLYCHGKDSSCDCEHYLYLTDMHMHCCGNSSSNGSCNITVNSTSKMNAFPLLQFRDRPLLRSYPRQTFSAKTTAKKCGVCLLWSARYVVHGDRLADKSPMLYCQ